MLQCKRKKNPEISNSSSNKFKDTSFLDCLVCIQASIYLRGEKANHKSLSSQFEFYALERLHLQLTVLELYSNASCFTPKSKQGQMSKY